jgi:hypothetical protein
VSTTSHHDRLTTGTVCSPDNKTRRARAAALMHLNAQHGDLPIIDSAGRGVQGRQLSTDQSGTDRGETPCARTRLRC